jgi:hypothetical protein
MPAGGGKAALAGVALAALAAGFGTGWIAGRATLPPPPASTASLADAKKDEVLLLAGPDGATQGYRVTEAYPDSVQLSVEDIAPDGRSSVRRFRAARSFLATLVILDGDIPPDMAEATVRDFIVERAVFEDLRVDSLERTFHCLKVTGHYRTVEDRTYWITDELPVHGIARIDGSHGKRFEVRSFSFGKGK